MSHADDHMFRELRDAPLGTFLIFSAKDDGFVFVKYDEFLWDIHEDNAAMYERFSDKDLVGMMWKFPWSLS